MCQIDYTELRNCTKKLLVEHGIDAQCLDILTNLYYDETGNIKKFVVKEDSFNVDAGTHFVLGGIEGEGGVKFEDLKQRFGTQDNITEIKSKHIYKGTFECCLKSDKLERFLDLIIEKGWHIHFQSLNILYWSIVDIVDSINDDLIKNPETNKLLKAMLYRVVKSDESAVAKLFYDYRYPDLKTSDDIKSFMCELLCLTNKYEKICPKPLLLYLSMLQILLKKGCEQDIAVFIQNEKELMLINELTGFYEEEIRKYVNSILVFDNESDIINTISNREYIIEGNILSRYYFVDSKSDCMIQLSDVFVGIMAKYLHAIDVNIDSLGDYIGRFNEEQRRRFCKLNHVINSSLNYNQTFVHQVTSIELHHALINLVEENNVGT